MKRKRTRILFAVGIALVLAGAVLVYRGPHCAGITSWDVCASMPGCSATRITVSEGYSGPFWVCRPKRH
ncbi:MAG TPA: hypothetical protein PKA58_17745 [Polyangium sp.]|nr:hypothetical protein [Polyangium sp.]